MVTSFYIHVNEFFFNQTWPVNQDLNETLFVNHFVLRDEFLYSGKSVHLPQFNQHGQHTEKRRELTLWRDNSIEKYEHFQYRSYWYILSKWVKKILNSNRFSKFKISPSHLHFYLVFTVDCRCFYTYILSYSQVCRTLTSCNCDYCWGESVASVAAVHNLKYRYENLRFCMGFSLAFSGP